MRTASALALLALVTACGPREPGPEEGDRGLVTYWEVTGSNFKQENCTDSPDWKAKVQPPKFEPNSFIMYRVAADGASAVNQDCTTTLSSSCKDGEPSIVFAVEGHTLSAAPPKQTQPVAGFDCQSTVAQAWTLEDKGATGVFTQVISVGLEGDPVDCNEVDNAVKAQSPNGFGLNGCKVTLTVDVAFYSAG